MPKASAVPSPPLPAAPGPNSTYEERGKWVIGLFKYFQWFHQSPKFGLVQALAKLADGDSGRADALEYASRVMDYRYPGDTPAEYHEIFTYPVLARFLYMFGDQLSPQQRSHLESGLVGRAKDLLQHGTENHAIMRVSSAYLFGQYFPREKWTVEMPGLDPRVMTSPELMAAAKALLMERGHGFYTNGNTEMQSPTYSVVNILPLLNLWDFAQDPEVRDAAEALLLYHVAELALNDFEGHIMPPCIRQPVNQDRYGAPPETPVRLISAAQEMSWLLWNQNEFIPLDFIHAKEPAYDVLIALSKWRPPEALNQIATGYGTPYGIKARTPYMTGTWGEWGRDRPDYLYRIVWRDALFAIGGGFQRVKPSGYFFENALFRIVWHSANRYNYLECSQPYWHSNQGEEDWDDGTDTPFQQIAVNENTAIVLFDIPAKDPWPGAGIAQWAQMRSQHSDHLLQVAQCRFPKTVDEVVQADPWCFLREGDVYIGIRVLVPGYLLRKDLGGTMVSFDEIKSYNSKTGFVFEAGTRQTAGSFVQFQARLKSNPLQIDWDTMDVSYTSSDHDTLRIKYNPSLTLDADGFADTIPSIWINDEPLEYRGEPLIESPYVTLKDSILTIGRNITVDWSGKLPVITLPGYPSSADASLRHGEITAQ